VHIAAVSGNGPSCDKGPNCMMGWHPFNQYMQFGSAVFVAPRMPCMVFVI
jgi:hypothetical protein